MAEFLCPYEAWEPGAPPAAVVSSGPESVILDEPVDGMLPQSGPVGFTTNRQ